MSDVSVVIVGRTAGLGAAIGDALGFPHLALDADHVETEGDDLHSAGRLIWLHTVPARSHAANSIDSDGVFVEAAALLQSARMARTVAQRSDARLVFIAVLPARGLVTGDRGAACDMALAAMDSLTRVEIGPWSNAGHRLLTVVHAGIEGYSPDGARSEDALRKRTPMHELCTVEQLVDAIRFVGSNRAEYITGTSLRVDGGWNAYSWMYPARTI
jgi:NAD(P)-dependent dehydrogenase (short-subunit alcohol dehydrogenase family)